MNFLSDRDISFANPWLLLLLLVIPLLAFLLGFRGKVPSVVFSSLDPLKTLGKSAESRAGEFLNSLLFLALAVLVVALARPQKGRTISHVEASGVDIMIATDVSGSMLTLDYKIGDDLATRIDTVKEVTRKFIEGRPNDRIGIIAFGGRPYLVSPLTLDHDWLLKNLDRVKVGLVENSTAIGSAIASACNRLKDREAKSKIIILLTDGDNNAGKISPEVAAEAAKALGIKFYAIGAGSNGFAQVPQFDQRTGQPYVYPNGKIAYTFGQVHFDEEGLKKTAEIAKGKYYRAADTESLKNIFSEIDKMEKTKTEMTYYKQYNDLFPWFLGTGLALLALHAVLSQTVWRKLP